MPQEKSLLQQAYEGSLQDEQQKSLLDSVDANKLEAQVTDIKDEEKIKKQDLPTYNVGSPVPGVGLALAPDLFESAPYQALASFIKGTGKFLVKGAVGTLSAGSTAFEMKTGTYEKRAIERNAVVSNEDFKAQVELGLKLDEKIDKYLPDTKEYAKSFLFSDIPAGLGSMAGFTIANTLFPGGTGAAGVMVVGALSEGESTAEEAYQQSGDIKAAKKMYAHGAIAGATEVVPFERLLGRIKLLKLASEEAEHLLAKGVYKGLKTKDLILDFAKSSLLSGTEEGVQEIVQQLYENYTAKQIYDTTRDLTEGVAKGGAVGFISAVLMMGLGTVATRMYDSTGDEKLKQSIAVINKTVLDQQEQTRKRNQASEEVSAYANAYQFGKDPNHVPPEMTVSQVGPEGVGLEELTDLPESEQVKALEKQRKAEEAKQSIPTSQAIEAGKTNVDAKLPAAVKETVDELDKMKFTNILDFNFILGKKNYNNFLEGVNEVSDNAQYQAPGLTSDVSNETIHTMTNRIYHNTLATALTSEVGKEFATQLIAENSDENSKELRRDLLVAIASGGGENLFNSIRMKYGDVIDSNELDKYIFDANQEIKEESNKDLLDKTQVLVNNEISDFSSEIKKAHDNEINAYINGNAYSDIDEMGPIDRGLTLSDERPEDLFEYNPEGFSHYTTDESAKKIFEEGYDPTKPAIFGLNKEGTEVFGGKGSVFLTKDKERYANKIEYMSKTLEIKKSTKLKPVLATVKGNLKVLRLESLSDFYKFQRENEVWGDPKTVYYRHAFEKIIEVAKNKGYDAVYIEDDNTGKWDLEEGRRNKYGETNIYREATGGSGKSDLVVFDPTNVQFESTPPVPPEDKPLEAHTGPSEARTPIETPVSNPISSNASYGDLLKDFKGKNVKELLNYLEKKNKDIPFLTEVADILKNLVGDIPVFIEPIVREGKVMRGVYQREAIGDPGRIGLNPDIVPWEGDLAVYRTLVHEAVHAWTANFMESDTKAGKEFTSKIESLIKDIQYAIDNPGIVKGRIIFDTKDIDGNVNPNIYRSLRPGTEARKAFDEAIRNPKELLSAVFSGNEDVLAILARVKFISESKVQKENAIQRFFRTIFDHIRVKLRIDPANSILNELENIVNQYSEEITASHTERLGRELPNAQQLKSQQISSRNFYPSEDSDDPVTGEVERNSDGLDNLQGEDDTWEMLFDATTIRGFSDFVATLKNITPGQYINELKTKSASTILLELDELDKKYGNVIDAHLRKLYKEFFSRRFQRSLSDSKAERNRENYEDFKRSIVVRKLNRAQELNHKDHYSVNINRHVDEGMSSVSYSVTKKANEFKTPKGNRASSLRESILLEKFIPSFTKLLGLPDGSISVAYINDFTNYDVDSNTNSKAQKSTKSLSDLDGRDLGAKKEESVSSLLSSIFSVAQDRVNKKHFVYLGNFAGKDTLPVLTVKSEYIDQYKAAIEKYYRNYYDIIKQANTLAFKASSMASENLSSVSRALLEDMWYGADLSDKNFTSIVAHMDFNAIQKRSTKWTKQLTKSQQDPEYIAKALGRDGIDNLKMSGIRYDAASKEVKVRTAVFSSSKDGVIEIDGQQYSVKELLNNEHDTPTTDGASFYILGQFDRIYHVTMGTLRDGTIKNFIMSKFGERPFFIKHAMHGLHPSDPLAKWMRANNIGMLTSDQAIKIGGDDITKGEDGNPVPSSGYGNYGLDEIANGAALEDERTFEIGFSNILRHSEWQSLDARAATLRQFLNGTSVINENPVFKEVDPDDKIGDALRTLIQNASNNVIQRYIEEDDLSVDNLVKSILINPKSPKQERAANVLRNALKTKDFDELISKYPSLKHIPLLAEHINASLGTPLREMSQMIFPGYHAALMPSLGILANHSQIGSVNNTHNVRWLLSSLPTNHEIFEAALPYKGLRGLLQDRRQVQRKISLGHSLSRKLDISAGKDELDEINDKIRNEINSIVREEKVKENANPKLIRKLNSGLNDPLQLLNLGNEKVKKYIEEYTWGKPINKDDGSIEYKDGIFDKATGRIKKGYVLITSDDASRFGIKPGDRVLMVVTPTDSALSTTSATVAGIIPSRGVHKSSDNNKVIVNSEWVQTMVGKDYDIDTITISPFDPETWNAEKYNSLLDKIGESNDTYIKHMKRAFRTVLQRAGALPQDEANDESIKDIDVFNDDYRVPYAQDLMGPREEDSRGYSIIGNTFHFINDSYIKNVGGIISARLYHTAMSNIKLVYNKALIPTYDSKGVAVKSIRKTLDINNKSWFKNHVLHLIMTNHLLDFPNNTSALSYNSDILNPDTRSKFLSLMYNTDLSDLGTNFVYAFDDFNRFLFSKAFLVASNTQSGTGRKASTRDLMQNISDQANIFNMLEARDRDGLLKLYTKRVNDSVEDIRKRYNPSEGSDLLKSVLKGAKQKIEIAARLLESIDFKKLDIDAYPLFKGIRQVDLSAIPVVGLTQKEALTIQAYSGEDVTYMYPQIRDLIDQVVKPASQDPNIAGGHYINKRTGQPYTTYSLDEGSMETISPDEAAIMLSLLPRDYDYDKGKTKEVKLGGKTYNINGLTERLQRAVSALLTGIGEIESSGTISPEIFVNRFARATAFPILFKNIMDKEFIQLTGRARSIILRHGDMEFTLATDRDGRILVKYGTKIFPLREISTSEDPIAKNLETLLTERDGIWKSYDNRKKLSTYLQFPDNLSLDEFKDITRDFIRDNVYKRGEIKKEEDKENKYISGAPLSRLDEQVFWLSFLGQLTNEGMQDKRAIGLMAGRTLMDTAKPYEFQVNSAFLELLSEFEPTLRDNFLLAYTNYIQETTRQDPNLLFKAIQNDTNGSIEMFEPDVANIDPNDVPKKEFSDVMYSMLKETKKPMFKKVEAMKFKHILNSQGYSAAYKYLQDKVNDISLLHAINASGLKIENLVADVKKLSPSQFKNKYAKDYAPIIHDTFKRIESASLSDLKSKTTLNPDGSKLVQIFHVLQRVRNLTDKADKELKRSGNAHKLFEDIAIFRERKVFFLLDGAAVLGFKMQTNSDHTGSITLDDLDIKVSLGNPTSIFRTHGVTTLAWAKTGDLRRSLSERKTITGIKLGEINTMLNAVLSRESRLDMVNKGKLHPQLQNILKNIKGDFNYYTTAHNIFTRAENLADETGIRISEGPGNSIIYSYGNKIYNDVHDIIDRHFHRLSDMEKYILIQAIEYRKIYDVHVRKNIIAAIHYLEDTLAELNNSGSEGATAVRNLLDTYNSYLKRLDKFRSNYMPHSYPIAMYKVAWKNQYRDIVKLNLKTERRKHQNLKRHGFNNYDAAIANMTDKDINTKAESIVENGWRKKEAGIAGATFIPNFQKRNLFDPNLNYDTTSSRVHEDYQDNLFHALERDLIQADYWSYINNVRKHGERKHIAELTRWWYADQTGNRVLHSQLLQKGALAFKRGTEINFLIEREVEDENMGRSTEEHRVYGVIESVDRKNGTVKLHVDIARRRFEIKQRLNKQKLDKAKEISKNISGEGLSHRNVTNAQIVTMKDLYSQGYIDRMPDYSRLSVEGANQIIIKALEDAYNDPSKLGVFKLKDMYTRDIAGNLKQDSVDRYFQKGAVEYLDGISRELGNIQNINNGKYDNVLQKSQYYLAKTAGTGLHFAARNYRKLNGFTILAGMNATLGMGANLSSVIFSNLINSPIRFSNYMARGIGRYADLRSAKAAILEDEDRALYHAMTAAGMMKTGMTNLVMDSLNIKHEDINTEGKELLKEHVFIPENIKETINKLWYLTHAFNDASGYKEHIEKLTALTDEYNKAQAYEEGLHNEKTRDSLTIKEDILRHMNVWRAKINKLLGDEKHYTKEELTDAVKKLMEIPADELTINIAEERGLTRPLIVKMMGKTIKDWFFQGFPFGLQMQAIPEHIRKPAFFVYYMQSRATNRIVEESIVHGLNGVEAWNANYGAQDKQLGATGTEFGRTLFQMSQYTVKNVSSYIRLYRDMITQGKDRNRKSELERKRILRPKVYEGKLGAIKSLLEATYVTNEEFNKYMQNRDYNYTTDLKLARIFWSRAIASLMIAQLGITLVYPGIENRVDPAMQAVYRMVDFLLAMASGDGPDDKTEWSEWAKAWAFDMMYMTGVPVTTAINILTRTDEESPIEALTQGRIERQTSELIKLRNSIKLALGERRRMTKQEIGNTYFEPGRLINTILGYKLFGTVVRSDRDHEYNAQSLFDERGKRSFYPGYQRPLPDQHEKYEGLEERFGQSILDFGNRAFPFGDRLIKIGKEMYLINR